MKRVRGGVAVLAVLAAVGAGGLAACAGPASSTGAAPSASASVSAGVADVRFAQMMIVHHEGAIEMARLAADRAGRQEVTDLALRIERAQQPEIDTMTGWLERWGEDPLDDDGAMPGMDHGAMATTGMGGMASHGDLARLVDARGADFDALFLRLMVVHHEGAVAMAEDELADGRDPDALALAEKVVTDQTAEIEEMEGLLATLGGE